MSKGNMNMPLTYEEISEILKLIDESHFDELQLEIGDFKLTIGKGTHESTNRSMKSSSPEPSRSVTHPEPSSVTSSGVEKSRVVPPIQVENPKGVSFDSAVFERDGLIPVKAPTLGIFYRSPKPGTLPFVDVGKYVEENDTICLIEVMKLFNAVKAGVKGRVTKICAENNQTVEYNQVLFLIKPEDPFGKISTP